MSIIASQVLNEAEKILKTIYDQTNAMMWLGDAIIEARSKRTDARLDDDGQMTEYADITSPNDVIPLNIKFRPVLADYVIARGFQEDADNQDHGLRADAHFKLFYDRIKTI